MNIGSIGNVQETRANTYQSTIDGQDCVRIAVNEDGQKSSDDPVLIKKNPDYSYWKQNDEWEVLDKVEIGADRNDVAENYAMWRDKDRTKTHGYFGLAGVETDREKNGKIEEDEIIRFTPVQSQGLDINGDHNAHTGKVWWSDESHETSRVNTGGTDADNHGPDSGFNGFRIGTELVTPEEDKNAETPYLRTLELPEEEEANLNMFTYVEKKLDSFFNGEAKSQEVFDNKTEWLISG
jgi:hypothetical protein